MNKEPINKPQTIDINALANVTGGDQNAVVRPSTAPSGVLTGDQSPGRLF